MKSNLHANLMYVGAMVIELHFFNGIKKKKWIIRTFQCSCLWHQPLLLFGNVLATIQLPSQGKWTHNIKNQLNNNARGRINVVWSCWRQPCSLFREQGSTSMHHDSRCPPMVFDYRCCHPWPTYQTRAHLIKVAKPSSVLLHMGSQSMRLPLLEIHDDNQLWTVAGCHLEMLLACGYTNRLLIQHTRVFLG